MNSRRTLNSQRIFAAADLLLKKLDSEEGAESLVTVWTGKDAPLEAARTPVFTQDEFIEAMAMLMRMGFVEPVEPKR